MKWHYAAPLTDADVLLKKVSLGGKNLCLIKYQNEYFALSAKCPHAGADLSTGWCAEGKLVCPFHRYGYNVKTGSGNPGQNDYVDTFPVEVRPDGIYVGIKSFWDMFSSTK